MYIDTHCHISKEEYGNIDRLIEECNLKNVRKIIISGCELNNIDEAIEISNKYENVYLSLGYHPSEASKVTNIDIENLKNTYADIKRIDYGTANYIDNSRWNYKRPALRKYQEAKNIYFSGNLENAKMYISIGYKLGIGGVITFKNSKLKDVIKSIDLKYIITETDSPYLAPEPYRGKQNCPVNIPIIVEEIAKQKNVDIKEVELKIENNVKELFQI